MDFPRPPVRRDEIHVDWDEAWSIERYVDDYLQRRKLPRTGEWREAVAAIIATYEADRTLVKSDLDYFLDGNASRWKPQWITSPPPRKPRLPLET